MLQVEPVNILSYDSNKNYQAKTCFKKWLWNLAYTEIKHIHGDNSMLAANACHAACAKKKHAIQAIMYMTSTFMLHDSLY